MKLQFKSPYLSVSQFDPVDLPDFSVLTGVNGSGKSHLLEAMERGHAVISGMENSKIVRFNYETFKLENESAFNAQQLYAERDAGWQFLNQHKDSVSQWKTQVAGEYGAVTDTCKQTKKSLWEAGREKLQPYLLNFKNHFAGRQFRGNPQAQSVYSLAKKLPYSIDEIPQEEFMRLYKPFAYKNDFLPEQLGKIIWDYYTKFFRNQSNEFQNQKHGKDYDYLSEQDFVATHGPKPWDLMNEILRKFNSLEYKINTPEGSDVFANFQLKLVHVRTPGLEIDFGGLSSGEKILMALVACVYKASTDNVFPDVLLLDEVDASLHPSMMKNMLDVIHDVFLARSIKVMLVTHSPTTIALAPEESVYVMNRTCPKRIEKKSKQEALSILTEGFATLDEGVRLFDEVSKNKLSIITEGNNRALIERACELYGCADVDVVPGLESISGKEQLKTLFNFFSRATHNSKIIFVWDCDVPYQLAEVNNTYPYVLLRNAANDIATSGIENMFPVELFSGFKKKITLADGSEIVEFDKNCKRKFEEFVLARNNKDDFFNFKPLIDYAESLK